MTTPYQSGIDAAYRILRCLNSPDAAVKLAAAQALVEAEARLSDIIAAIKREQDGIGEDR